MASMPWVVEDRVDSTATALLRQYLGVNDVGSPQFAGSYFDVLGRFDGDASSDRLTAEDILAAHLIGATMSPHAMLRVLTRDADVIADCLGAIPPTLALCDASAADVDDDSAAGALRAVLRGSCDGLGMVAVTKLMARKRPMLFPVWDAGIFEATAVDAPSYAEFVRVAVQADDRSLWRWLAQCGSSLPEARHLSPLRILDILLWTSTWSEHHWPSR